MDDYSDKFIYEKSNEIMKKITLWSAHNFPMNTILAPAMGVLEEYAEYLFENDSNDKKMDALGDMMIYSANLCGMLGLDFGLLITQVLQQQNDRYGSRVMGSMLMHNILKYYQRIRNVTLEDVEKSISIILNWIRNCCTVNEWKMFDVLMITWKEVVEKRNWQVNSKNGEVEG